MSQMKSENWIIVELLVGLMALGVLSFFFNPVYEKGTWLVIGTVVSLLSMIFGYKFGKSLPSQIGEKDARDPAAKPQA
jgi:uncharacterized membrane protein